MELHRGAAPRPWAIGVFALSVLFAATSVAAPLPAPAEALAAAGAPGVAPATVALAQTAAELAISEPAILSLTVNGIAASDVVVQVLGEVVWVGADDLKAAGVRFASDRRQWFRGRAYVSLAELAPLVTYDFDLEGAHLRLRVSARSLGASVLDLRPRRPEGLEVRNDTSAFLNYAPRLQDGTHFQAFGETGVRHGPVLAQTGVTWTGERQTVRGLSQVTYERPAHLQRWHLGDAFRSGGDLSGPVLVGGLTFSRSFELDPYRAVAPGLSHSGSVDTPATVDVYVNDTLVRSEPIPAGAYRLENLPLQSGDGQVRYVVRDVFGQQREFQAGYYLPRGSLAKGESSFSYTLGVRRLDYHAESFDYGSVPVLVGRHRLGLSPSFTLGWSLEADPGLVSGGADFTLATPAGAFDLSISGSRGNADSSTRSHDSALADTPQARALLAEGEPVGAAAQLGYTFAGRELALSTWVRGATPRYTALGIDLLDDRPLVMGSLAVSTFPLSWLSATLQQTGGTSRDLGRTVGTTASLGVQLTQLFDVGNGAQLRVSGSRTEHAASLQPVMSVFAFLSTSLGGAVQGRVGARARDDGEQEASVGLSRTLPIATGAGFNVNGGLDEQREARFSGTVQGHNQYGHVQYSHMYQMDQSHGVLEAAGGIAFVAGAGVFFSRPVREGYAVVSVPDTPGVGVRLNNNHIGETDADGHLLVPNLQPYYANRLSVDDTDLPLDRRVDRVEEVVMPAARGGVLVRMQVVAALYVRGVLLRDGAPVVGGELVVLPEPATADAAGRAAESKRQAESEATVDRSLAVAVSSLVGNDGAFELSDLSPGRHAGRVRASDGTACTVIIDVPVAAGPIVDVGPLPCVPVPVPVAPPSELRLSAGPRPNAVERL